MSDLFDMRDDGGEHLSQLELDRLLAGEKVEAEVRERLEGCGHCQKRLAELEQQREAFLAERPPHTQAALIAAAAEAAGPARKTLVDRLKDWRIAAPLAAALTAAVILLVIGRRDGAVEHERDVVRLKGGEQFQVLAGHPPKAGMLEPGPLVRYSEPVAPGTTLGFRVLCTDRCQTTIVGISERGGGYVVDAGRAVEPGKPVNLDFTVELDDTPGDERLYALFCSERPNAEGLADQLERLHPETGGARDLTEPADLGLAGCAVRSQLVERAE